MGSRNDRAEEVSKQRQSRGAVLCAEFASRGIKDAAANTAYGVEKAVTFPS